MRCNCGHADIFKNSAPESPTTTPACSAISWAVAASCHKPPKSLVVDTVHRTTVMHAFGFLRESVPIVALPFKDRFSIGIHQQSFKPAAPNFSCACRSITMPGRKVSPIKCCDCVHQLDDFRRQFNTVRF